MITVIEYQRSPARFLAARGASGRLSGAFGTGIAGSLAPLRLINRPDPKPPAQGWARVRPLLSGICGSDLALLTGRSSPYLSPVVSMPFVPGHEVVGTLLDDAGDLAAGSRVVLDPILSCEPRDLTLCPACAAGHESRCDHVTAGSVSAGQQTGYCHDTGGGWGGMLVAHASQLHAVPEELPNERAVLVEPLACAVHTVRRAAVPEGASVVIVGAGTVGLLTLLALREFAKPGPVYVIAKHGHQRERARALGATDVLEPRQAARTLRRATGASLQKPERGADFLLGGVDVAIECTGGSGLDSALRLTRAGGRIVLSGMPSTNVDLTPLWYRELTLVGAYASDSGGHEHHDDFVDALSLVGHAPLDGFVDAVYPLTQWREAIGHALAAGRLGSVKVVFDPARN
ncbi:MAG TPA: zinc-binding dehydrogenase [Mycobacteriales bacterium]|nr:zinc-binding dehydrogenase [Mycobacteriales bacterium]